MDVVDDQECCLEELYGQFLRRFAFCATGAYKGKSIVGRIEKKLNLFTK